MKAMNGSGGLGIRRLCRLLGCVAALAALSAMAIPSIAAARVKKAPPIKKTYVALGDSLAFGYSQQLFNENEKTGENPAGFENGYASVYFTKTLNENHKSQEINYGCPGETTESLIGDNATFLDELNAKAARDVQEPITGEAPCAYHTVDGLPLHNEYGAGKSQLEAALETIATEQAAGKPVKWISLDIGANDELHTVAKAEKEATTNVEEKVGQIIDFDVFEYVEAQAAKEVEAYVVEQVIPQAYEESGGASPAFEEDIAKDAGEYGAAHAAELAELGNKYAVEYPASHGAELEEYGYKKLTEYEAAHGAELKQEGAEIALGIIKADLPSVFAQIDTNIIGIITAIHDAGFRGQLIFVGTYDPYGRVGGIVTEHKELEPGFNEAAAELVGLEQETLTKARLKVKICYSNNLALFNPATYDPTEPVEVEEEAKLAAWTNMANFTPFEYAPGKVLYYDEKADGQSSDGPDIHATPKGYEEMAGLMASTCG
jgi:lysophospholipase L1-like esterase